MALQKTIVTPANNVLGTYGVLGRINIVSEGGNAAVTSAQLSLYASQASFANASPAVATYTYSCGNAPLSNSGNAIVVAENAILSTDDSGTWSPDSPRRGFAGGRQQSWIPGWIGGSIVS